VIMNQWFFWDNSHVPNQQNNAQSRQAA